MQHFQRIPHVSSVDETKDRFIYRPSDFPTLELCGAMSSPNHEVGELLHIPSFPSLTLLLPCSMQL